MNTIEKLRRQENFTPVESSLADYILNHLDTVQNMSLQELTHAAYVSNPSAIRLYRKLGFRKYREFSLALQIENIRQGEEEAKISQAHQGGRLHAVAEQLGKISRDIVNDTLSILNEGVLQSAVERLNLAERIFVYVIDGGLAETKSFLSRMSELSVYPVLLNELPERSFQKENFTKNDCLLVIAAGRELEKADAAKIRLIKQQKAGVILVTTKARNSVDIGADLICRIYTPVLKKQEYRDFTEEMALLFGLNILYGCLREYRTGESGNNEGKGDRTWEDI